MSRFFENLPLVEGVEEAGDLVLGVDERADFKDIDAVLSRGLAGGEEQEGGGNKEGGGGKHLKKKKLSYEVDTSLKAW